MITPFTSQNADLLIGADKSAIKSDVTLGASTLDVYSIGKFAVNKILWIGEFNDEGAEIIKTHSSTAPSGTTVTLLTTLVKNHPKDTPVYIIPYDQAEFSHSATTTGVKSVLSLQTVDPEREGNRWDEPTQNSGYVFTRFYNSISAVYSNYSDPYPFSGLGMNTFGYVIEDASAYLDPDGKIPFERKIRIINKCLRYIRGKLKKWNTFQEFDYVVDQVERGKYEYDMPTTAYDRNSNKSVLSVRVGSGNYLQYMDKREMVSALKDSIHTTVATEPTVGQVTLVLADAHNLSSSGSVDVFYNDTLYNVTYTGITSNTLTGVPASGTGSITVAFPVGTNVWYGENEGEPTHYSVYDGKLVTLPMADSDYAGQDLIMDFYTDVVEVDSEADEITLGRYDMVYYYLTWELRNIQERNGKKDYSDGDWMMFKEIMVDAIKKETSGQKYKMKPKVSKITDNRGSNLSFDRA